jgi:protein-tyrosine phosphatase
MLKYLQITREGQRRSRRVGISERLTASLRRRYGGKRAFVHHLRSLALLKLGKLRCYTEVDWLRVERVVFVCKGNICRSPYAQAKASSAGITSISCGLYAQAGVPADPKAVLIAARRKISLIDHRASCFREFSAGRGDLIICMEPSQAAAVKKVLMNRNAQVTLLGLWAHPCRPYLHDPYSSEDGYWESCFSIVDSAVERIVHLLNCGRDQLTQ